MIFGFELCEVMDIVEQAQSLLSAPALGRNCMQPYTGSWAGNPFTTGHLDGAGLYTTREEWVAGFYSMQWSQLYLALTVPLKSDVIIPGVCTKSGASKGRNKVLHCTREWWTHVETIKSLLCECHSWWMSVVVFICVSTETVFWKGRSVGQLYAIIFLKPLHFLIYQWIFTLSDGMKYTSIISSTM